MDLATIKQYLQDLGEELARRKFDAPVRVLMIGGAFMLSQLGNRASTQDIDIILLDWPATTDEPPDKRARAFRAAAWAVAKMRHVPRHSLNDDSAFFVRELTRNWPEGILWFSHEVLEVYVPPKDFILALKLMTFRAKDREDILTLLQDINIQTRAEAQALLDRYIFSHLYIEYEVPKTLMILFEK